MRTLIDLFLQIADAPPRDNLLAFRGKNGKAVSISSAEFVAGVLAVRRYLQELGLREGDRQLSRMAHRRFRLHRCWHGGGSAVCHRAHVAG
jgi:hypothetical protein